MSICHSLELSVCSNGLFARHAFTHESSDRHPLLKDEIGEAIDMGDVTPFDRLKGNVALQIHSGLAAMKRAADEVVRIANQRTCDFLPNPFGFVFHALSGIVNILACRCKEPVMRRRASCETKR